MSDIRIINFGLDSQFSNSQRFIRSLIQSFQYDKANPASEMTIDFKRALGIRQLARQLSEATFLGHVMAHGTRDAQLHGLYGFNRANISELIETNCLNQLDGLLLDACQTMKPAWQRAISRSLAARKSIILIGTTCDVGWDEACAYTAAFYSSLLQSPIPSTPRARRNRILAADSQARRSVERALKVKCSYEARLLTNDS